MINMYSYTYASAVKKYINDGYILCKVGDSTRNVEIRKREQRGASEYEDMIHMLVWNNLKNIKRDYEVHRVLTKRGLHNQEGKGTEWFKIPGTSVDEAGRYLDDVITKLEGHKVRKSVILRTLQSQKIQQAMDIIAQCVKDNKNTATIIAHLCPRFGKTIWALMLFNKISEKYGNRVMLLPAYWLSVHSSFIGELDEYKDFNDIAEIDVNDPNAGAIAEKYLAEGMRIVVPLSLHGKLDEWCAKYKWLAEIDNGDIFNFADEGDFGTHTDNQVAKLDYLFEKQEKGIFVSVYASGTNIQRLAKCTTQIDGVLYTAYSQLEQTEPNVIKRKFFCTEIQSLKEQVEKLDARVMPSWSKIWGQPLKNKEFVGQLLKSLVGKDTLRAELNLSAMTNEPVDCFMLLVSANKKEMKQIANIAKREIPDWHVKILNGDYTTNKKAEDETAQEINEARIAGKKGVLIIANAMGSRSFSIAAVQASVIAFDRGSVDATTQKVSRCLTPPKKENKMYDNTTNKEYGFIVDLSFDPNRAENIERLILDEALQVQRSGTNADDFTQAVKYVLTSVNLFKMNEYGYPVEVSEEDMFAIFNDNDAMLRVADSTVDAQAAMDSGMFDILSDVTANNKAIGKKKDIVGKGVKNSVTEGGKNGSDNMSNSDKREAEKIINDAIRALNMSATSVYFLAGCAGESYRECLTNVNADANYNAEFTELFGVDANDVNTLLDNNVLNEAILDVIVQNSKPKEIDFLF